MKENHLYVYIPRPNTVQRHGVYAPSNAPFEKVQHYVKRTAEYYSIDELDVDHKKIMQYLETWFHGRSRAISVLTEPIPDTASERILEFRNMSDCITLPSFEELKKYNIAEACYLSVDGGKDKKVDGPDYSPVNWKQDKTPQFRFKGIRHYFIVLKSGVVPAKYCTIGNDFTEESLSDKVASNVEEFAQEAVASTASKKKMYFANNNGCVPHDKNGSPVLVSTIDDAKIYFGFDNFWDNTKPVYYRGTKTINGKTYLHFVHGDASKQDLMVCTVTGTIYEIEFDKPVEFRLHGNRGFGCKNPKIYTAKENVLQTGKIHKNTEEETVVQVVYSFNKSLVNHSTEDFSQENLGSKDDTFVRDIIRPKIRDSILYHGSAEKHIPIKAFQLKELRDKKIKTISLTPYKRLASLFCVPFRSIRENEKGQVIYHHAAFKLDEWFEDIPEDDKYKAVQAVHISHNIKELSPTDKVYTGYLHYVDAEDALEDAGRNPINDKGPNEVVCFKSELKPFKVEQIHVRMISRYSPSFAKEVGHDAESCEPEDIGSEEFIDMFEEGIMYDIAQEFIMNEDYRKRLHLKENDESLPDPAFEEFNTSAEFDLSVGVDLLQEFNAGIEEFNRWVRDLDLYSIKKELNDPQVDMVFSQIAQENILVDTVKSIFRKIGEFIAWFFRKLKELWNYFFGKTQRAMRALKAANERITRHKNSNGFFNDGAFEACKAPEGLVTAIGLNTFIITGFSPDVFNNIFKEILDLWVSNPQELYDEIFVKMPQLTSSHKWKMLYVLLPLKRGSGMMEPTQLIKEKYPARGSMHDSAYDRDSVFILLKGAMDMLSAYEVNSKLISSKGNITVDAANRILQYQDRTDVSEHEAIKLAKDIQELANWLQVMFKGYEKSFEFVLYQMGMITNVYGQFMK